jgi:hypothetical protein
VALPASEGAPPPEPAWRAIWREATARSAKREDGWGGGSQGRLDRGDASGSAVEVLSAGGQSGSGGAELEEAMGGDLVG